MILSTANKRNIYIGLALIIVAVIALVIIFLFTGSDNENNGSAVEGDASGASGQITGSDNDSDDSGDGQQGDINTTGDNDGGLSSDPEVLQNYLRTSEDSWGEKYRALEQYISENNISSTSCVSDYLGDGWIGAAESRVDAWGLSKKAQQSAEGQLKLYLDGFIGLFDGIDAEAYFAELDAITATGTPGVEQQLDIVLTYGLGNVNESVSELEVRHKVVNTIDDLCAYDINYSLD